MIKNPRRVTFETDCDGSQVTFTVAQYDQDTSEYATVATLRAEAFVGGLDIIAEDEYRAYGLSSGTMYYLVFEGEENDVTRAYRQVCLAYFVARNEIADHF